MKLLEIYRERYEAVRPQHVVLVEAAHDGQLHTDDLIGSAVSDIEHNRAGEQPTGTSFALLVLQQRTTPEVLQAAYSLLGESAPAARQLGTSILREFPRLDEAPYPHSAEAIRALEQMLRVESDVDVLSSGLGAIGWQRHPMGLRVLLRYANHGAASVRETVATNILVCCSSSAELPPEAYRALLAMIRDPVPAVRSSVFWDIAEYPDRFREWRAELIPALRQGGLGQGRELSQLAARALAHLQELPSIS